MIRVIETPAVVQEIIYWYQVILLSYMILRLFEKAQEKPNRRVQSSE